MTGYRGTRRKIPVIDDVAQNRAVAVDILGQFGFEMIEAELDLRIAANAAVRAT